MKRRRRFSALVGLASALVLAAQTAFAQSPQTAPAADETFTLVVLPPQVKGKGKRLREKVGTCCDLLAERIARDKALVVVDRRQLARVLAERRLSAELWRAMRSYDAMVRVSADFFRPDAQVTVTIFDLSMGNVVRSKTWPWEAELTGEQLDEMAELCRSAAAAVLAAPKDKITVRFLGVRRRRGLPRLAPLIKRLAPAIEQMVDRSERAVAVHHLESASAQEESLFLLMGLSRLAGGRRFQPQADVTLEVYLDERDEVGKAYRETPVEATYEMRQGQPSKVTGTYGESDKFVSDIVAAIEKELARFEPVRALEPEQEMAVRRRQAEAELASVQWGDNRTPDRVRSLAAAAATAEKLDPTCAEAALRSLSLDIEMYRWDRPSSGGPLSKEQLAETRKLVARCFDCIKRFGDDPENRRRLLGRIDSLTRAGRGRAVAPELLDEFLRSLEMTLDEPLRRGGRWLIGQSIKVGYDGLLRSGKPVSRCRAWRDETFRKARARLEEGRELDIWADADMPLLLRKERSAYQYWTFHEDLERWRFACLLEDGEHEQARLILIDLADAMENAGRSAFRYTESWKPRIKLLSDPRLESRVREVRSRGLTLKHGVTTSVRFYMVPWPKPRRKAAELPKVPVVQAVRPAEKAQIIGRGEGRAYALAGKDMAVSDPEYVAVGAKGHAAFGYFPVDEFGAPTGPFVPLTKIPLLRKPAFASLLPRPAVVLGGKLVAATVRGGLLIYDIEKKTWTHVTTDDGLPWGQIETLHALDDATVLCLCPGCAFTYDVRTGRITLRQKTSDSFARLPYTCCVWPNGKRIMGINLRGLMDDMLGPNFRYVTYPVHAAQGWACSWPHRDSPEWYRGREKFRTAAVMNGRVYVGDSFGLWELGADGKVLRAWGSADSFRIQARLPSADGGYHQVSIARGRYPSQVLMPVALAGVSSVSVIGHDGTCVYVYPKFEVADEGARTGVICFDPEKDMWYGPVLPVPSPAAAPGVGKGPGVWLADTFVNRADFINAAKNAGLAFSTAELTRRWQAHLDAAPPLDRAKYAFGLEQFDKAKAIFGDILNEDPKNPDALYLMGLIHVLAGEDEALKYFDRLAAQEDIPSVSLLGWYARHGALIMAGKFPEAIEAGRTLLERFDVTDNLRRGIRRENSLMAAELERRRAAQEK